MVLPNLDGQSDQLLVLGLRAHCCQPSGGGSHGRHFGQTQDDEELTNHHPTVAPKHARRAAINQHLKVVEDDKLRSNEVRMTGTKNRRKMGDISGA